MFGRIISLWDRVRTSLWGLPLAVAALCAVFAVCALSVDLPDGMGAAWLYSGTASQAPAFAASLVGAMITLTALAFSITMVVLTLAAQQLGPRLVYIFMSDPGTKLALGLFLGTDIYLLLVLRSLNSDASGGAPNLAITGGTALVLASVVTFLFFVHSLVRSVVSDNIVARVGDALDDAVAQAFPAESVPTDHLSPSRGNPVTLDVGGYVQRIDYGALVRAAQQHNAQVVLAYRAGRHVIDGEPSAWITGCEADAFASDLGQAVVITAERTRGQDPAFFMRQLVEIALRALSPGINDEFTSFAVIDRLSRAIAKAMRRGVADGVWFDRDGEARVFGPTPTFAGLLEGAFDQIREAGADKFGVLMRLTENLRTLGELAEPRHKEALARQIADLSRLCERAPLNETEKERLRTVLNGSRATLLKASGSIVS